jgi:hypothetical protein
LPYSSEESERHSLRIGFLGCQGGEEVEEGIQEEGKEWTVPIRPRSRNHGEEER